ncbi:GNAT family N-acetyltransferase [Anaerocolumna jejuensis]|uniref:GNAT family N-acetyltransferase n=1 Tax=Anaerocolumna jejuensis TaxID=259063 RepID=UPI003F7BD973
MIIRKLTSWQEWLEAERINSISFLHTFEKEKAKKKYKEQAEGKQPRTEEAWGSFYEDGTMASSLKVYHHRQIFDGQEIDCGEIDMVSSLPEARESGNIRNIIQAVFADLIDKDFVFSFLHPFSFIYYRQFGYELCSSPMSQKLPVAELKNFPRDYKVKMVEKDEDVKIIRSLYEQFIQDKNLGIVRPEGDWHLREDGDFGSIDFFSFGKTKYGYIFFDDKNRARGYIKFSFEPSKENFIIGSMNISEMVYDSPDAFQNIMGFIYKMRAKCEMLSLELPEEIDMATLIPNGDKVDRRRFSQSMARILNIRKALEFMRHPEDSGIYTLEVIDDFLPQNTGFYSVSYNGGKVQTVTFASDGKADITVNVQTLCQMVLGLLDLNMASYRLDVKIHSNKKTLAAVFTHKKIFNQ